MPTLENREIDSLVSLIDQIAGWRSLSVATTAEKARFIKHTCSGSLPGFLLRLLKSDYVRGKYREEYNKSAGFSRSDRHAIIAALYIAHIGHNAPISFLSNAFQFDVGAMVGRLERSADGLKLLRRQGSYIQTVPAIGATNILEHMVPDPEVVDSVVSILEYLSEKRDHDDFERHMFNQMMRYSILRSVITNPLQIDRFFDNISKIEYLRRQILFWLQWHMAKTDLKQFGDAEKYLEQGYREAESYERRNGLSYNRKQLDDRKAKFLMLRAQNMDRQPPELFRDLREACQIVGRLLRNEATTRHPFQTLEIVAHTFVGQANRLALRQRDIARGSILANCELAAAHLKQVPEGYQRSNASKALETVRRLVPS